jgi:hypothetical protein
MEVRNTLADFVVDGHKSSFSFHAGFHGECEKPGVGEKGLDPVVRQIRERLVMIFGYQEAVSRKERAVIEKSQAKIVFKHYGGR